MQGKRENYNHGHVFWTGIGTYLLRGIWARQNLKGDSTNIYIF